MKRHGAVAAALLLGAVGAAPAAASSSGPVGVFGPVSVVGVGTSQQDVALGTDGSLLIAWAGDGHYEGDAPTGQEGVWVAQRAPGALGVGPPQRLTAADGINRSAVSATTAPDGTRAIAYYEKPDGQDGTLLVSVAAPGQGFGAPQAPPLPTAVGEPDDPYVYPVGLQLALTSDDRAVLVWHQGSDQPARNGTFAVVRRPDGSFGALQQLSGYSQGAANPLTAAGPGEALVLITTGSIPDQVASRAELACRIGPGEDAFSACQPVGTPGMIPTGLPALAADARGDAIVTLPETDPSFPLFARGVTAVSRRPGGAFSAPKALFTPGQNAQVGVGTNGDALAFALTSDAQPRPLVDARVLQPDGSFSASAIPNASPATFASDSDVAVDAAGGAVIVSPSDLDDHGKAVHTLAAWYRPPSGPVGDAVDISAPGARSSGTAVAADAYGNGIVTWIARKNGQTALLARVFAARAPGLKIGTATTTALPVVLSDPATVTVDVLRRATAAPRRARAAATRRLATVKVRLPAGRSTVRLPAVVRTARGPLTATVRAANGGPRNSPTMRVVLRRR